MSLELTGEIAARQKEMKAQELFNSFIEVGMHMMRICTAEEVVEVAEIYRLEFKKYGIDIVKFLKEKEKQA